MKKRILSIVFVLVLLMTTLGSSCFANERNINSLQKNSLMRLGGGDSPSAGWEKEGRAVTYMTKAELQDLLELLYDARKSNAPKEKIFQAITELAALSDQLKYLPFLKYVFPTQKDIIEESYDEVLYALTRYDDKYPRNAKFKVRFELYVRPANGEKMASILSVRPVVR